MRFAARSLLMPFLTMNRLCNGIQRLNSCPALISPTSIPSLLHTDRTSLKHLLSKRYSGTATPSLRRRGLIRPRMTNEEEVANGIVTQYTINDIICPPTNSTILKYIVQKHIDTLPKYLESKPIAQYNVDAFHEALQFVAEFQQKRLHSCGEKGRVNVILDSGCGTGRSTRILGNMFPDWAVIGIDRSLVRLNKNWVYRNKLDEPEDATNNVLLLRADLIDFWHLCLTSLVWQQTVHVKKHYLLYPNPYPKKARLKNRFYAHPAFPLLMLTLMMEGDEPNDSTQMIVRSNWKGYLEEFALSVAVWKETELDWNDLQNVPRRIDEGDCHEKWTMKGPERIESATNVPMTNFEAKFFSCGEPVYELDIKLLNNTTRVF